MKNEKSLSLKIIELIEKYDIEQPFSDDADKNRFELMKKILRLVKASQNH